MKARLSRSDAMVSRLGETDDLVVDAEWFQLTYNTLREAPDGNDVAFFDPRVDGWFAAAKYGGLAYSDIVIFEPNQYEEAS